MMILLQESKTLIYSIRMCLKWRQV